MKKPTLEQLKGVKSNKSLWLILMIVVLIVASLPAYYYYSQYKKTQALLQNPTQAANTKSQDLINKIGKLIELPKGETPTIATVSDITKLVGQPFFANAKNGDKVLIFTQTKEAILFRESIDKIIQVAQINIGSPTPPSTSTAQITANIRVAIYNGTTTVGLAGTAENKIKSSISGILVSGKADAKGSYAKTEVIDVSGNQSSVASKIANLLGGSVSSSIPSGETKPNADIVIILGTDFVGK